MRLVGAAAVDARHLRSHRAQIRGELAAVMTPWFTRPRAMRAAGIFTTPKKSTSLRQLSGEADRSRCTRFGNSRL